MLRSRKMSKINICAVDLFCGIGGLTYGLRKSGIKVKAGIDNDDSCRGAYERNNKGIDFISTDIRQVTADSINRYYEDAEVKVLVGCAPCQPFSAHRNSQKKRGKTTKNDNFFLLLEVSRLIKECQPDIVSIENVPGLINQSVYSDFLKSLKKLGFHNLSEKIVFCPEYGIPQTRKRLVLLASKLGDIELVPPPYPNQKAWKSVAKVANAIKGLPHIQSGERSKKDIYHVVPRLTEINLARIKQSVPGGNWRDWDKHLVPPCRRRSVYDAPYGRMEWGKPAPTITTQFFGYSDGRFGHPTENRAISLREGGLLQTFPKTYKFHGRNEAFSISRIARHIGNAVPVTLAKYIGKSIVRHVNEHSR